MLRRQFLALGAGVGVALARQKPEDAVVATATQDTTPRVGIALSSFKEGTGHDGTTTRGLDDPRPPDADLTSAQLDAMVRRAIDLAATRQGEFHSMVEPEDWVVIKTHIPSSAGAAGSFTDPRIVGTVISYLAERRRGLRFTVVEGSKSPAIEWSTDYRKMIEECGRRFPGIRFEIADLNTSESIELPVPGRTPARSYRIPKIIQQCDRLISVAPLKTDPVSGVSLSVKNYLGIAPGAQGRPDEVIIDLFSYHPADFAILGGSWGIEGDGASVHHNIAIAGVRAICVDAVAAAVMGFNPADLPFLALGERKGFGTSEVDAIWTHGNQIEEARRNFRKPAGWRPPR